MFCVTLWDSCDTAVSYLNSLIKDAHRLCKLVPQCAAHTSSVEMHMMVLTACRSVRSLPCLSSALSCAEKMAFPRSRWSCPSACALQPALPSHALHIPR